MMKATQPGTGDHSRGRRRLAFHGPSIRRVLIEGIVNPVVVRVVDVITNEPPEMLFVQRDDMIEKLAAPSPGLRALPIAGRRGDRRRCFSEVARQEAQLGD